MKVVHLLALGLVLLGTGCASTVKTYDATGKLIGSCEAHKGFVVGASAVCTGTANQEGK